MRRSAFYKTMYIGSGLVLMAFYNNCSKLNTKISVTDIPQTTMLAPSISEGGDGSFKFEGTFQMGQKTHSDLDLIWVLDNSGSMSQEIAHVKANLEKFTEIVGNQSNLRMALISKSGSESTSYNLNASDPSRFIQINRFVDSTNALFLTGAALCADNMGLCSTFMADKQPGVPAIQGQLNRFLRSKSKKVFVIVSDDESDVSPDAFTSLFEEAYPKQSFTLFGFVGLGAESPCQARKGERYIQLAQRTKGQTYNICDADWSSTFSTLAESVLNLVAPTISLPHPIGLTEVLNVVLEGQPLDPSQYQITSSGIVINVDLLAPSKSYRVQVNYRLK